MDGLPASSAWDRLVKRLLRVGRLRVLWWPGSRIEPRMARALTVVTGRGELLIRFGRDDWVSFSERYAGTRGIPPYWYGPWGLAVRWAPRKSAGAATGGTQ